MIVFALIFTSFTVYYFTRSNRKNLRYFINNDYNVRPIIKTRTIE